MHPGSSSTCTIVCRRRGPDSRYNRYVFSQQALRTDHAIIPIATRKMSRWYARARMRIQQEPVAQVHPNGPRTFASFLRDSVPLATETADRLLTLDVHHPTLGEMREALGLDLDLTR